MQKEITYQVVDTPSISSIKQSKQKTTNKSKNPLKILFKKLQCNAFPCFPNTIPFLFNNPFFLGPLQLFYKAIPSIIRPSEPLLFNFLKAFCYFYLFWFYFLVLRSLPLNMNNTKIFLVFVGFDPPEVA